MARRSSGASSTPAPSSPALTPTRHTRWLPASARAHQQSIGVAAVVAALILIAVLTLTPGGRFLPARFELCLICGDKGTADLILNVLLFVPLGFGLRLAGVRRRTAWAVAVLLTITIEALQYYVVPGRQSGVSDLVSNSLGGVLGVALADAIGTLLAPTPGAARRLALGAAVGWCVIAAGAQWILEPALPRTVYYQQIAPDLGQFALFDGVVLDASFDGQPFHRGRMSPESSAAMRAALLGGHARIVARVLPGSARPRVAPIVSVFDQRQAEILVLARRHDDVVLRVRRHSEDLKFLPVSLTLSHAFPSRPWDSRPVTVTATVERSASVLKAVWMGGARETRLGSGVWQGWRLFLPDDARYGDFPNLFTAAWVMLLGAPVGYWAGCATRHRGVMSAIALPIAALLAGLAIIPWVAGALAAPWPAWAAGAVGVSLAMCLARRIHA